jgi:hypothetical protein
MTATVQEIYYASLSTEELINAPEQYAWNCVLYYNPVYAREIVASLATPTMPNMSVCARSLS